MKKVLVIIILLSGTLISNAFPAKGENIGNEKQIISTLISKIKLSDNLKKKNNSEIVNIEFVITTSNTIEIKNVSGKNVDLKNEIKAQLENQKIEVGSLEKNVSYFIDINFKII